MNMKKTIFLSLFCSFILFGCGMQDKVADEMKAQDIKDYYSADALKADIEKESINITERNSIAAKSLNAKYGFDKILDVDSITSGYFDVVTAIAGGADSDSAFTKHYVIYFKDEKPYQIDIWIMTYAPDSAPGKKTENSSGRFFTDREISLMKNLLSDMGASGAEAEKFLGSFGKESGGNGQIGSANWYMKDFGITEGNMWWSTRTWMVRFV